MELKKQIAKIVSKISVKSALSSTDSASRKGYSQPKEPEAIAKLRRK